MQSSLSQNPVFTSSSFEFSRSCGIALAVSGCERVGDAGTVAAAARLPGRHTDRLSRKRPQGRRPLRAHLPPPTPFKIYYFTDILRLLTSLIVHVSLSPTYQGITLAWAFRKKIEILNLFMAWGKN